MQENTREIALNILERVEKGAFSTSLLTSLQNKHKLSRRDRSFVNELVSGVLKNKIYLDNIISNFSKRDFNDIETRVCIVLRLGVYQIIFLRTPDYASVSSTVSLVDGKNKRGFVNAILRKVSRKWRDFEIPSLEDNPVEHISIKTSHPPWLVKKWIEFYGIDETFRLCNSNNEIAPLSLRVNRLLTDRESLKERLSEIGIKTINSTLSPYGLIIEEGAGLLFNSKPYYDGFFYIQDISAQFPPLLLNPQVDEKIGDLCCGLGGKTSYLAELCNNRCDITAVDTNQPKLDKLKENLIRLKITSVQTRNSNILDMQDTNFDAILLDVPCSNSGVLRRKPELKYRLSEDKIKELVGLQKILLHKAWGFLKNSGRLIYSTCSILEEENWGVVKSLLEVEKDIKIIDPGDILPQLFKEYPDTDYKRGITLYPHINNTDGCYFIGLKQIT
jgi:16S rRNA (cytosine967-C5)-methyltransferase